MMLEAIYSGGFYPSLNGCTEAQKIPERAESLRENYGSAGRKTERRRLRFSRRTSGSDLHCPGRGERVSRQVWLLGGAAGVAGSGGAGQKAADIMSEKKRQEL